MVAEAPRGTMKHDSHLVSEPWSDYELLDSGDNMKLERFGEIIVARPETQALWKKLRPELWNPPAGGAHAVFNPPAGGRDKKGRWNIKKSVPESWQMSWRDIKFLARLTGFKHTGVFPEQAPNWKWLAEKISKIEKPNVLNLFGYTGIASLVSAQAGAFVTHVDASKQSLDWARENARLSDIPEDKIRWILDDALAFAKREARRGAKYDGIILDPPVFGRGAKGEVWKIEEDFLKLLESLKELLSEKSGSFFLLNGYAAGFASRAFAQAVESVFAVPDVALTESGELHIKESSSERVIPSGIYVRFVR
ncbi:class I SAM-dependent methyltransferase [Candidatus Kaiserbacteria bacterium]|nr:class I SAM-dependent methyltransferase [Candidatus Kaiserbacteria bacterium]